MTPLSASLTLRLEPVDALLSAAFASFKVPLKVVKISLT
jgi:hypothetical protein